MMGMKFTPGPWRVDDRRDADGCLQVQAEHRGPGSSYCVAAVNFWDCAEANARLVAAAPDHALIGWAMCVQDGTWEEWAPFDGSGEFCFAGLRYTTRLDEFGIPKVTPALREAITQSQTVPA
jgi:hypothetical protein